MRKSAKPAPVQRSEEDRERALIDARRGGRIWRRRPDAGEQKEGASRSGTRLISYQAFYSRGLARPVEKLPPLPRPSATANPHIEK
jgi:hypothetical protein